MKALPRFSVLLMQRMMKVMILRSQMMLGLYYLPLEAAKSKRLQLTISVITEGMASLQLSSLKTMNLSMSD